jgi:hypothetical protein
MKTRTIVDRDKLPRHFQVGYRVSESEFETIYAVESYAKNNGMSRNQAITKLLEIALRVKK